MSYFTVTPPGDHLMMRPFSHGQLVTRNRGAAAAAENLLVVEFGLFRVFCARSSRYIRLSCVGSEVETPLLVEVLEFVVNRANRFVPAGEDLSVERIGGAVYDSASEGSEACELGDQH
jgi:hypothetical protein